MSKWDRQKSEIYSYNLFYAAIKSRHNTTGLAEHGYNLVGSFMQIPGSSDDPTPGPDFTLFHEGTILFVEIKAGENINVGHIKQMKEYNRLGLESVENFAMQTELADQYSRDDIEAFEHCIIYNEEFIEECKSEYPNCRERLDELSEYSPVLTQDRGSSLLIDQGSFKSNEYDQRFSEGVPLPQATDKVIYLPENIELEALSYSISHDIVLNNLNGGSFEITPSEVQSFHGRRDIRLDKIKLSLEFLENMGACREQSDGSYLFHQNNLTEIFDVEELLREKPVTDYLGEIDEDQSGLGDFT